MGLAPLTLFKITSALLYPLSPFTAMIILLKNRVEPKDSYEEELQARNEPFCFFPVLEHSLVDNHSLGSFLQEQQSSADALIVTSQRAVEALNLCKERSSWLNKPIYTVGPATAKVITDAGFVDVRGGTNAGDGSILADLIINDHQNGEKLDSILFLTGETRRDIIPRKLNEYPGITLQERIVYKTQELDGLRVKFGQYLNSLQDDASIWIVFFSPSGSDSIIDLLKSMPASQSIKLAAIGPTTYDYLTRNGFSVAAVAEKPHAPSLAKAIFDTSC